jgi:hypothetical protein
MELEQIIDKIAILETKISQLEQEILTATGEEKIALQNRISQTQGTLTELYKLLQIASKNFPQNLMLLSKLNSF